MFNRIRSIRKRTLALAGSTAFLAAALVAGTVFATATAADAGQHDGYSRYGDADRGDARHGKGGAEVMARVAEILEIEEDTLRAAFATARDESADARFEERVQDLRDDETITAEEAAEANDWFDERPDGSGPLALKLSGTSDSDTVDDVLDQLVEKERLTREQADAMSDWHDDRPSALPERERRGRGHGRGHHSHHGKHGEHGKHGGRGH